MVTLVGVGVLARTGGVCVTPSTDTTRAMIEAQVSDSRRFLIVVSSPPCRVLSATDCCQCMREARWRQKENGEPTESGQR
jgi:hypothetical protein